jgi:hypothetical protein
VLTFFADKITIEKTTHSNRTVKMVATLSTQNIFEAIESSKERSSGCRQMFVKLTESWGVKIFSEDKYGEWAEESRDETYELQQAAAAIGCGPDVGDKVDLPTGDFGYITEVVQLFNPHLAENAFSTVWPGGGKDKYGDPLTNRHYDVFYQEKFFRQEIRDLKAELYTVDFDFNDTHGGNMGWKNGKLICIDFC